MKISVSLVEAYGRKRFYPENDVAKGLMYIFNRVCFTEDGLNHLRGLGFTIDIETTEEAGGTCPIK